MKTLLGSLLLVLIHANVAANDSAQIAPESWISTKAITIKPSPPPKALLENVDAKSKPLFQVATGNFPCKHGGLLSVHNNSEKENQFEISLDSLNKSYQMQRVRSVSGAVRLESDNGRIVLLQLANKTMLLDLKRGNTLATDCQSVAQRLFAEEISNNPKRPSLLQ